MSQWKWTFTWIPRAGWIRLWPASMTRLAISLKLPLRISKFDLEWGDDLAMLRNHKHNFQLDFFFIFCWFFYFITKWTPWNYGEKWIDPQCLLGTDAFSYYFCFVCVNLSWHDIESASYRDGFEKRKRKKTGDNITPPPFSHQIKATKCRHIFLFLCLIKMVTFIKFDCDSWRNIKKKNNNKTFKRRFHSNFKWPFFFVLFFDGR